MITKKIKLVIFDVDGTILDTERPYVESCMKVLKDWGYHDITREPFYRCMGLNKVAYEEKMQKILGPEFPFRAFRTKAHEEEDIYYQSHLLKKMPGVDETFAFLKENSIPMAIATSRYREKSDRNLAKVGLLDSYDFSICGDEIINSKPDPEIFLKAAKHFNTDPSEAVVIEDSSNGLKAAINGGFRCILVPHVAILSDDDKAKAFRVVKKLDDIVDVICEVNGLCRK